MTKIKKIEYDGEIILGGYNIPCYVLEDGTRVLSGRGMQSALKMVDEENSSQVSGKRFDRYLEQKTLQLTPKNISRKPQFVGKLTKKYIYSQLPKDVVEVIREKTQKKYRWYQALTPEIGKEHLKRLIAEVTALMSVSNTKEEFDKLFNKRYMDSEQMELKIED